MTCTGIDDHDLSVPHGFLGPYPMWGCSRCNAFALYPSEDVPSPAGVVLEALERAGCEPRPVDGEIEP